MTQQVVNRGSFVNDPTAETIYSAFGKVNANTAELYGASVVAPPWHNVLAYGAVGNANTTSGGGADDTAAIQAAYDAAALAGGYAKVVFPGARTYRITSTINVGQGIHTEGFGGRNSLLSATPPVVCWGGANNGIMFQVLANNTNIFATYFENLRLAAIISAVNKPLNGIKFTGGTVDQGNPDSGSGLRHVWFESMAGDSLNLDGAGCTNFFIEGGRFDSQGGYGIKMNLSAAGTSGYLEISGNTNWVGGTMQGSGFLFVDAENATSNGTTVINIRGLHTEVNQDMTQTFAAGANPYDRCGIIRLGVKSSLGACQHMLSIHGWICAYNTATKSTSAVQITANAGTVAAAADAVLVQMTNVSSISQGTTDAATTGQIRMFGGMVPAERQFPLLGSYRFGQINWGQGPNSDGNGARSFSYHRHGSLITHGLSLHPELVAGLSSNPITAGAIAYVTDATITTLGTTVVGGGANKVLVLWNGTNWKIIANCN